MNVTITPAPLHGAITPPPSKSQGHRLLIGSLLAGGGTIQNLAPSQDIQATRRAMEALLEDKSELPLLDCGESGSTLRFLIPLALALKNGAKFTGQGRLMERPQDPYFEIFEDKGIGYHQENNQLIVEGTLTPGDYFIRGDVSSQFITGLLYALPLLDGPSRVIITTPLESADYVYLTMDTLVQFGIRILFNGENAFDIEGGQSYRPIDRTVEADWSQAAFWYAAAGIGNDVKISGTSRLSMQGDRIIDDWKKMLDIPGDVLLDVAQTPDLVPPLAAWAALREGRCHIVNAARLRLKESDRLATVTQVLTLMGAAVQERGDSLTITGSNQMAGGVTVKCHNDHRIAMMAAVAATRCERPVTLLGAECVAKSYPNFWEDFRLLGGQVEVIAP